MQKEQTPMITYKPGLQVPVIGLGTFLLEGDAAVKTIVDAYEVGYRLIDTATLYQNHEAVGQAAKIVGRENLIICTKINEKDLGHDSVEDVVKRILDELDTDYLDIVLSHHPCIDNLNGVLNDLVMLQEKSVIKSVGVSNFSIQHLESVKDYLGFIDVNQIEVHPYFQLPGLYAYCREHDIQIMGFRPFLAPGLADDGVLLGLAEKYGKTWRQVVLRWIVQRGFQVVAKASSRGHLAENLDVFGFELSGDEVCSINGINKNLTACSCSLIQYVSGDF
jgi:diketogulonate reductase-like aldo/keto reductase